MNALLRRLAAWLGLPNSGTHFEFPDSGTHIEFVRIAPRNSGYDPELPEERIFHLRTRIHCGYY